MATDGLVAELLGRGSDDWVTAAEVAWVVRSLTGAAGFDEITNRSIDLISAVVDQGLMRIGDVTETGFVAWDLEAQEALDEVSRRWRQRRELPDLGDVCWLSNTEDGDARAAVRTSEN